MATLTFYGLDEMSQSLLKNANPERRQRVLKKYGSELKENAIGKAQFSGKYTTGATRRSITLEAGGDRAVVTAHTKYSGYLEDGGTAFYGSCVRSDCPWNGRGIS
mgnify:CR=1 FL=1